MRRGDVRAMMVTVFSRGKKIEYFHLPPILSAPYGGEDDRKEARMRIITL